MALKFQLFTSDKPGKQRLYFRIIIDRKKVGHSEGYANNQDRLRTVGALCDGAFKVKVLKKEGYFTLVGKNGEPIFQSNFYKEQAWMNAHVDALKAMKGTRITIETA